MHGITYTSPNGYRGVLYGERSMAIFDPDGRERLHTGSRGINTMKELKEVVDSFPEFLEMLEEGQNEQ